MSKKKTTARIKTSKRRPKTKIRKWQIVLLVLIIASVGIVIVYKGFASGGYVFKKSYLNTDKAVLQTPQVTQTTFGGGSKKTPVVQLSTVPDKTAAGVNNLASYKFNLPVGEYRLCQRGQVTSDYAVIEIGLIANGADATAGTYKKSLTKSQGLVELVCSQFNIPLNLPANAGAVEYFVKITQDPASPGVRANVLLSSFDISVQNDIDVGTYTRNHELRKGDTCKGERIIGGKISDQLGNPVPAQIGLDFNYPDDYTGPKVDDINGTGYERLVYLNITDPNDKNTYWCADIPPKVSRVSIESYSRTVYDHAGQLVNNALLFGDSQTHGVDVQGLYKKTVDLVLPNTCGSPGVSESVANTGKITVESVRVNGDLLDIEPKSDPNKNAVWRSIAWSRGKDPGQNIAGYNALNVKQPHTPSANVIDRLASRQKYLTKFFVVRGNHQYKFEIPSVYVADCGDTHMRVAINDSQFGVYDSSVSCFARVFVPGRPEESIDCSSIVEEKSGTLVIP